jgi:hypothetical protein
MNKEIIKYLSQLVLTLIILITSTFIWIENQDKKINFITNQTQTMYIEELSNPITLANTYPTKDTEGLKEKGYTFKVKNNQQNKEVTFYLQNNLKNETNQLNYKYIRYQVTKNNHVIIKPTNIKETGILFKDTNTENSTYEIKMWIDYNSDTGVYGKKFSTKLALL